MYLEALLIFGTSFIVYLLPVAVWKGLPLIPLLIAFSFPHFVATYVIWGTKRRLWETEKLGLAFPLIFILGCWLADLSPNRYINSLPYHLTYIYLVYHFARQMYGASMWGAYRLRFRPGSNLKLGLNFWFLIVPFTALYSGFRTNPPTVLFYHEVLSWPLPEWPVFVLWITLAATLVFVLILSVKEYLTQKSAGVLWPLIMLLLPLFWFLPPFHTAEWVPLVPLLHALQYLPFWGKLLWKSTTPLFYKIGQYLLFVLFGWFLFRWFPLSISNIFSTSKVYAIWIAMLNAHHFWIDSRIWKLRDEKNSALFIS